jgi:hypothetical protein
MKLSRQFSKADAVGFDVDGTLASMEYRRHFVTGGNRDWDSFFGQMNMDAPVPEVRALLQSVNPKMTRLIMSARPDNYRYHTEWWLAEHGMEEGRDYDHLMMRRAGDNRQDPIVKGEMLDKIQRRGGRLRHMVDDRPQVVDMWRSRGVPTTQVTDPNLPPVTRDRRTPGRRSDYP